MRRWRRFSSDESGATAVEYGLIVSLIFLAIVVSINTFTNKAGNMFNYIANNVNGS